MNNFSPHMTYKTIPLSQSQRKYSAEVVERSTVVLSNFSTGTLSDFGSNVRY